MCLPGEHALPKAPPWELIRYRLQAKCIPKTKFADMRRFLLRKVHYRTALRLSNVNTQSRSLKKETHVQDTSVRHALAGQLRCGPRIGAFSVAHKINISALDIGPDQLHAQFVR